MSNCDICGNILSGKQKKYCSVECQYEGYKVNKIKRIDRECLYCKSTFTVKITDRKKYCSRKCVDLHKKETYLGKNNPQWNIKFSDDRKKLQSENTKKSWKDNKIRKSRLLGIQKFVDENGYYPGTDEESKQKRKQTMFKRYGIVHNWNGIFGKRKCDVTTINKYGKDSTELRKEGLTPEIIKKRSIKIIESITGLSYDDYNALLSEKDLYWKYVWKITNNQPIHLLENHEKRGRAGKENAYHLDHIISIWHGFCNDISPYIIGDISNLRFITWEENLQKGRTIDEKI